jgi:hypothetical protein
VLLFISVAVFGFPLPLPLKCAVPSAWAGGGEQVYTEEKGRESEFSHLLIYSWSLPHRRSTEQKVLTCHSPGQQGPLTRWPTGTGSDRQGSGNAGTVESEGRRLTQ